MDYTGENIKDLFAMYDDKAVIKILFTHSERQEVDRDRYKLLENCFRICAEHIFEMTPNRIERFRAILKLQEASFWAFAALDREHPTNNLLQFKRMQRELAEEIKSKSGGPEEHAGKAKLPKAPSISPPGILSPPPQKEELGGIETETGRLIKSAKTRTNEKEDIAP